MDPFTLALATFGIQKLRGKSTKKALQSAALIGGGSYALGQVAPQLGIGMQSAKTPMPKGDLGTSFLNRANMPKGTVVGVDKFGKDIISRGGELSGLNVVDAAPKDGITANLLKKIKEKPLESTLIASTVLPLLAEEEVDEPMITQKDYDEAYAEEADKLSGAFVPVTNARPALKDIINDNMFYANQGGLATALPKFNRGGVNYLPSKTDHNENDYNNYVRAEGYVEDGSGNGNKDEDTMLAQLADGEFVSRADAVLGAGILSGADPKSFKNMRKAGADFFYDQQKKFKRIYDIVNASRKDN
tara:strand:- start:88 stop:993 length:906 start_codon:yes stop_codon:yes gene_type:complete